MRSADIDRGALAGARGALDVPDDRDFASSGLEITIYAVDSDLDPLTTPDGAIFAEPFDRPPDGAHSRVAQTSSTRTEAHVQCSYVLHSSVAPIETGQSRGGRDGVAIFRLAIGRRALVFGLERCCWSFLSRTCYFVYLSFIFCRRILHQIRSRAAK